MTSLSPKRLMLWRDISPSPVPLTAPTASSPRVLVVGGGVIGLTTAWTLLDKGYYVTIIAKEWASYGTAQRLTSQISGALWEYPPAVCGQHTDLISLKNSRRWCMVSYHIWDAIAAEPGLAQEAGVTMKPSDFFFPFLVKDDAEQLFKMNQIMESGVRGFRHAPAIIQERGINPDYGTIDAYELIAPIIDTDRAMSWLMDIVRDKGAQLITRTIEGDLLHQEHRLRKQYNADVIINATGLAGTELAGDPTCYPIRGGLIRVLNDGTHFPVVDAAMTISADVANEIVFIVPRNNKTLILGGIAEANEGELSYTLDTPIIKRMGARCVEFLPQLKKARLDPEYPLAQGLRPFRKQNVRCEREARPLRVGGSVVGRSCIIHSYGHGGAGWSLAFGCAEDVLAMVEEVLRESRVRTPVEASVDMRKERDDEKVVARL